MPSFCIDMGTFEEDEYVALESLDSNPSARLTLPFPLYLRASPSWQCFIIQCTLNVKESMRMGLKF